ncbi:MAG TPA: MobF family relaxase [Pirellulales bacterium]|nr:MobF family relaxase [Pirellulales bacterium]
MLRMFQNSQPAGAKSYYSTADYYTEGQELSGRWRGEGALLLGLEGNVKQAEWDALCDNRHPATGEQLTARMRQDRTVGYDMNFHVPKSVSLLYAMTKDERLLDAFRDAARGTMHDIEAEMQTRVRKGGRNEDRTTGNMVWGEFVHFTSRPVDGVPDPHLHAHCFVFNTTFDGKEQAWKAGQFRDLKRDAPYFEAVFHSRLAHRLEELGLETVRGKHGWELAGVGRDTIEKFSRRTAQIEEKAHELGIDDAVAKDELGAKTRQSKKKDMSFPELQSAWRERMTGQERGALHSIEQKIGGDAEPIDGTAAARAVEYATQHSFERKSVIDERRLLAEALKHGVGKATVEEVHRELANSDVIIAERHGRRMATTREVLAEEKSLIAFAREGRGTCRPFAAENDGFSRDWLSEEQRRAVAHITGSRDRVTIVRGAAGAAGAGKTSLMQEAVEHIEAAGTKVIALAPSASASRGTLRDAGFRDADTVARFLLDDKLQEQARGQLIWIDEAGQLGARTMAAVFRAAEKLDTRVLLSGDRRQHGSVERGAALRLLEDEAGVKPAEVREIQRQKGAYKEAVKALGEGRTAEGFRALDELGWVKEVADDERYQLLASDYVEAVRQGKTALVVSPTHAEGNRITNEIRRALKESGEVDANERTFPMLHHKSLTEAERGDKVSYEPGDVLVFHQNAKGFMRGDRLAVDDTRPLPLAHANRFDVFRTGTLDLAPGDWVRITRNGMTADGSHRLNNGTLYKVSGFDETGNIVLQNGWTVAKDFGHLAHGYVVTSHASQGRTVDVALIGQASESFPASSKEQFYVSASRARKQVVVYTSDKEALKQAIEQTEERLTATDLVAGGGLPRAVILRQLQPARTPEPERQKEPVLAYGY